MLAGHLGWELHLTLAAGVMGQLMNVSAGTKKILLVISQIDRDNLNPVTRGG